MCIAFQLYLKPCTIMLGIKINFYDTNPGALIMRQSCLSTKKVCSLMLQIYCQQDRKLGVSSETSSANLPFIHIMHTARTTSTSNTFHHVRGDKTPLNTPNLTSVCGQLVYNLLEQLSFHPNVFLEVALLHKMY